MPTTSHEPSRGTAGESLKERYHAVKERVAEAAARSGRRTGDIVVVAVTKFASIDQIRQMIELGQVDFGENRVQNLVQRAAQIDEYLERHRQLRTQPRSAIPDRIRWHMIGTLQRNKVRKIVPIVRLIHSVDSLRLAEEIQACASRLEEPVEVLVQVNASGERSKHGVAPAATRHLVEQIDTMINLRPRGLMCIGPLSEDPVDARPSFELCHEFFEDIRTSGAGGEKFDILSMGMTSDFEVGIECGANVVRIGRAIFGEGEGEPEPE